MRVAIWRASDGWRWQLRARNGRIIGASSEAYRDRARCIRNLNQVTAIGLHNPPRRGNIWESVT